MKAFWNNKLLAESEETVIIEGDHYFPIDSLNKQYFRESDTNTICPWRGIAYYLDIDVNGETNKDAAWYFLDESKIVKGIVRRIACWRGVEITG